MTLDHGGRRIRNSRGPAIQTSGLLLGIFALLVAMACGGGTARTVDNSGRGGPVAASIAGTIAVGTGPISIAVDSTNNKIFVADLGSFPAKVYPQGGCYGTRGDVSAIDGSTQLVTSMTIGSNGLFPNVRAVTVNSASHIAYAVSWEGFALKGALSCGVIAANLAGFDAATLNQTLSVTSLRLARMSIGADPLTDELYLAGGNRVMATDTSGNILATISAGTAATGIAVNATTNQIYVANSGSNNISVIDGATHSIVNTISDPKALSPVAVAVNSANNKIYVANSGSNNVTVIDGATGTVIATISVGTAPFGVDVDSQTNYIYVANAGNPQAGDPGNISVINGATNATQTLSDSNAKNPVAIAVNSVTDKIYVSNSGSNNVTVIDGAHD